MRWTAALLVLVISGCTGGSSAGDEEPTSSAPTDSTPTVALPLTLSNQGGDLEGHGPRGFAGQGVGLFAGDNLNANFPEDDGVQIWLSFDLPHLGDSVDEAHLVSSALSVSGDPFATLGELSAEAVSYDSFVPELFDLQADGPATTCVADVAAGQLDCDVSEAVAQAVVDGLTRVQFRLKFDQVADNDGEQDLALFFLTDSNTNEPGIFSLNIS